jgi:BASS family bile acid:Na+ symporter
MPDLIPRVAQAGAISWFEPMVLGLSRTGAIILALLLGALVPAADAFSGALPWLVMVMLFPVFLEFNWSREAVRRSHGWLLLANVGMAFAGWGLGRLVGGTDVALAGFFAGLSPTATAAAVVMSFLGGEVGYVITGFMVTNLGIAVATPVLLPLVLSSSTPVSATAVIGNVTLVVLTPLLLARLVRAIAPPAAAWPARVRDASFLLWVTTIFLVSAHASHYLRAQAELPVGPLAGIVLTTAAICAANFALGAAIGAPHHAREASQTLGQKNTAFTIYLAMAHAGPLAALGPTFYVVFHNLWNSWQLQRRRTPPGTRPESR